mgnify:CR=1 FL=1
MISQKKRKNNLILFFLYFLIFLLGFSYVNSEQIKCNKFDLKCKSKNWVNETKDFQKEKLGEVKDRYNKSKETLKKVLPIN